MSARPDTPRRIRMREKYGQEFLDAADAAVAAAPPMNEEQIARLRATFARGRRAARLRT